ncbi:MAG: hypothetical protein ABI365_03110 [Lysobacteraceae bacterium]
MSTERDDKLDAQDMNLDPLTGTPGSHPVGTGIGATGGAVMGAAAGSVVGPIGTAVGGIVGAVVGGLVGSDAGEVANPTAEAYWRVAHVREPYYNSNYNFDDYGPAYKLGYESRDKSGVKIWDEQQEVLLHKEWESSRGLSRLSWDEARKAARAGWVHIDG